MLLQGLWYSGIAADAILLTRLLWLGFTIRYPVLCAYLGFEVVRSSALAYLLYSGRRLFGLKGYNLVWVVTQPVLWALYFLIVLEFYSRMLEEFPGIRRLGRLAMFSALGAVTLACAAVVVVDEQAGFDPYPVLSYLMLQERSMYLCLSGLALLLLLFVAHYRLSIARNVWLLYGCFGSYFLASTALFSLRRYFGASFNDTHNLISPIFYAAALLGAGLFISKAGEREYQPISAVWGRRNRELEAALSVQLQSFNQVLVKALRQ